MNSIRISKHCLAIFCLLSFQTSSLFAFTESLWSPFTAIPSLRVFVDQSNSNCEQLLRSQLGIKQVGRLDGYVGVGYHVFKDPSPRNAWMAIKATYRRIGPPESGPLYVSVDELKGHRTYNSHPLNATWENSLSV